MSTSPSRRTAGLAVTIGVALLVSGCAGETAKPTTQAGTTTTTPTATTTATGPMTDSELAWLNVPTNLRYTTTKVLTHGQSQVTRAMLEQWVRTLRSCSRELARLGAPSARLQPVYVRVKQAASSTTRQRHALPRRLRSSTRPAASARCNKRWTAALLP